MTDVSVETGTKRVFAWAVEWPGWCRSGKNEDLALESLAAYAPRYAPVAELAGVPFPPIGTAEGFTVVERVGGSGGTDFGVPNAITEWDRRATDAEEARRMSSLVQAAWTTFQRVVARAPAELRKGPRGGGRDRDRIVEHVLGAEAAYARTIGLRHRQPAADDEAAVLALRQAIVGVLAAPSTGEPVREKGWPTRYAARRIAWHVLDHAWEIEDRSETAR